MYSLEEVLTMLRTMETWTTERRPVKPDYSRGYYDGLLFAYQTAIEWVTDIKHRPDSERGAA